MFNYSHLLNNMSEEEPIIINVPTRVEDLTSIGIFISSILLSLGGCITMILAQFQKSKCKTIKLCGFDCKRELQEV